MYIQTRLYCSRCLREMPGEGVCPFCGYDEYNEPYDEQVLETGLLLDGGRYCLGALIGKGGFGMTYAAWDEILLCPVAIKEYFPAGIASRDVSVSIDVQVASRDEVVFAAGRSNFMREAQILAALEKVPHVVKVSNCFEENGTGYIVMEYVRGVTLTQYVREHQPSVSALMKMLRAPIDSLVMIHRQGVMHRDITPNNLMVQEDGSVVLIDFGAAYVDESKLLGKAYDISATKHYAALEQYDPTLQQGQWTDVYGLSATLYALLTGCEPPDCTQRKQSDTLVPPRKINAGISRRQQRAILGGMALKPDHRIASMDEFRCLLYHLPTPEIVRQRRRMMRRMAAVLAAAAVIALLTILNFTKGFPLGGGLYYGLHDGGWQVMGASKDAREIDIASGILLLPVTGIKEAAFAGRTDLTSVSIPDGMKTIGERAFFGCGNLHTVILPETLQIIGEMAFMNTPPYLTCWGERGGSAQSLAQEAGVTFAVRGEYEIDAKGGEAVLTAYTGQTPEAVLPSYIDGLRVTAIDEAAAGEMFNYGVTKAALPYFLAVVPSGLFADVYSLSEVRLGPNLLSIGEEAFCNTALTQIDLPATLTQIGRRAFVGANLGSVQLPDGLKEIGEMAFSSTRLETVEVPASVTALGEDAFGSIDTLRFARIDAQIQALGDAFSYCPQLTDVRLSEGIERIESFTLTNCTSLTHILLPKSVVSIDHSAFGDCVNLRYVYIPETTTEIHQRAFSGCAADLIIAGLPGSAAQRFAQENGYRFEDVSAYTAGLVADGKIDTPYLSGEVICPTVDETTGALIRIVQEVGSSISDPLTSIRLPSCALEISTLALARLPVRQVIMPDTLRSIDSMAFLDCDQLEEIRLPEGLVWIGSSAFEGCTALEGIKLPDTLRMIDMGAFEGCQSITQVNIPPLLTELSGAVFAGTGISQIVIPGSIVYCSDSFENCLFLETAVVEEGCTTMLDTFAGCASLRTLSLPASLRSIDMSDYAGCVSLEEVYIHGMNTTIFCENGSYSLDWQQEPLTQAQRESYNHPFRGSPGVTIHAPKGSSAERYAQAYGLAFEAIDAEKNEQSHSVQM